MLGEKIKQLRTDNGLTQKDLADKLFVTAQAVSRWENNEVEPSVSTLTELAKIFNVSVSEIVGEELPKPEVVIEKEIVYQESKPVLAVCEQCNKPIYNGKEIVRIKEYDGETKVLCKDCDAKNKEKAHSNNVSYGLAQRKKSFIWSGIISGTLLTIFIICAITGGWDFGMTAFYVGVSIAAFTFSSCLFLKNNFIEDIVITVGSWGYVRFPGLIYTLDLDGIIWLLTVKLAFWIIGLLLATAFFILSVIVGLVVSLFVYPFALAKNIRCPEQTDLI